MTREVRWFQDGRLPRHVFEWFDPALTDGERRVDDYDLASAGNGIGRKHRSTEVLDTKFRTDVLEGVQLAPGLSGDVEDWMKITDPLNGAPDQELSIPLAVHKHLHTRRYLLDETSLSGCEVELADIRAGALATWSLCFETFGPPERRMEALRSGVDQFIGQTPLPDGLEFGPESCLSYPAWLARLALQLS